MIRHISRRAIFILAAAIAAAALVGLFFFVHAQEASPTDSIAREIVKACANSGSDHSACYGSEVPNLYPKLSVPQIFDVVREIRVLDPSYQFCHVLGHEIGNRVVAEDPSQWLDDIPLNPSDGLCSNGFIHGVFEERFGADVLTEATIQQFMPQFKEACQPHDGWQPSALDQAVCYHGMGHVADFITNADLPEALNFCTEVAPAEFQRVCVQGVFMQIYQPLEPDDYALIAQMKVQPTPENVRSFCAAFGNSMYVGSCLEESWPFFEDGILDGTGVQTFCSGQPDQTETDQCYVSMSSIVGRVLLATPQRVAAACNNFPVDRQETCYSYSAQAVLEESLDDGQKAIDLCNQAQSSAVALECLSDLAGRAGFTFGPNTALQTAFCDALPDSLQPICLATQ